MPSRQVRQELTSLDKQRHFDLIKLALDNPEFFEVMDGSPLEEPDGRRKIGANLTLNYWLAMWELGEVAEPELRALTTNMFRSRISRAWWGEVNQSWITARGRRRRQFLRIVHEEWMSAGADAVEPPPVLEVAATGSGKRHGTVMLWCTAASIVAGTIVTATRRRRRHATGG